MRNRALAIFALALAVLAGFQTYRLATERAGHARTRAEHALEITALATAAREAEAAARAEEQRRTAEVQKAADEADQALDRARADADAARDVGQRLRDRLATLTAACRVGPGDPAAAGSGQTADATARMLADVQRRLDEAQDRIAQHADQARTAGLACQRLYNALTP